jgi:hypothetical protein
MGVRRPNLVKHRVECLVSWGARAKTHFGVCVFWGDLSKALSALAWTRHGFSRGGGWGAGAQPRLYTCREFQFKIEKVTKTHEVSLCEVHGPGGKSPGFMGLLFYT